MFVPAIRDANLSTADTKVLFWIYFLFRSVSFARVKLSVVAQATGLLKSQVAHSLHSLHSNQSIHLLEHKGLWLVGERGAWQDEKWFEVQANEFIRLHFPQFLPPKPLTEEQERKLLRKRPRAADDEFRQDCHCVVCGKAFHRHHTEDSTIFCGVIHCNTAHLRRKELALNLALLRAAHS